MAITPFNIYPKTKPTYAPIANTWRTTLMLNIEPYIACTGGARKRGPPAGR